MSKQHTKLVLPSSVDNQVDYHILAIEVRICRARVFLKLPCGNSCDTQTPSLQLVQHLGQNVRFEPMVADGGTFWVIAIDMQYRRVDHFADVGTIE